MPFVLFLIGLVLGAGGLYGYLASGNPLPNLGLAGNPQPHPHPNPLVKYNTVWHGEVVLQNLVSDIAPAAPTPANPTTIKPYSTSSLLKPISAATSDITDCLTDLHNADNSVATDPNASYSETSIPTGKAQTFDLIPLTDKARAVFYQASTASGKAGCAVYTITP